MKNKLKSKLAILCILMALRLCRLGNTQDSLECALKEEKWYYEWVNQQ